MDPQVIERTTKALGRMIDRNSPTILSTLAIGGLVGAVIFAIKATKKANEILDREREFRREELNDNRPLTPVDVVDLTWRLYTPTALMTIVSGTCIICSNSISSRRNATLASLLALSETALHEYQDKVVETIGKKKEETIRAEIIEDRLKADPVTSHTVVLTGKGSYLCYETYSGRYFKSDIEQIRQAVNEFNAKLIREGWMGVNDFYYLLGLESVDAGDQIGWEAMKSLLEIRTYPKMASDGEPCLAIEFSVQPKNVAW